MTTDPAPRHSGKAIAYLCSDEEPASAELFTAWCEHRATADGWTLTEVITDTNDLTPLVERTGWQRVKQLLTEGETDAVITVNRRMIAETTRDWVRVTDLLASLGATLTTSGAASRTPIRADHPVTGDRPALARGAVHRLALNATAPDPTQRLACIPSSRAALRSTARQWGITGDDLDDILTIATELLTNAIQHTPPTTIHATLRLVAGRDLARIEVTDSGQRLPCPGVRDAERGRGLLMVTALADRWGISPAPGGKTVWAEFALWTGR